MTRRLLDIWSISPVKTTLSNAPLYSVSKQCLVFLLDSMFILFSESRKWFLEVIADEHFVEPKGTSVVFNSVHFISRPLLNCVLIGI